MSKNREYLDFSESKNWNQADMYSKMKILKYLILIDEYEFIANFGTSSMLEEFILESDQNEKTIRAKARIKALNWMRKTLELIIDNCKFALKKEGKQAFEQYKKNLIMLKKIMPSIESRVYDEKAKKKISKVNEENFDKILDILSTMKTEILEPMNQADLIFTSIEEFDPDEYKKKIMNDWEEGG